MAAVMAQVFKHSIKVPRFYKHAARCVMDIKSGSNMKTLISEMDHPNKRGVMALVLKTLQHKELIDEIFKSTNFLKNEERVNEHLAAVLATELLWGKKKLPGESKPIETILKYEALFLEAIEKQNLNVAEQIIDTVWRPRYVRVNILKQPINAVINHFTKRKWNLLPTPESYSEFLVSIKANLNNGNFMQDFHMQEFLLFPQGTVFAKNALFKNGAIILQDKSSSLAVKLLDPKPGSTVLDMCAAPGMKTSHIAAYMNNNGKIFAVDHDKVRFATLRETIKRCKLLCVKPILGNILELRKLPNSQIEYIALDPSCSGSGMLSRLAYDSKPSSDARIKRLSNLQKKLLRYALTCFPKVKRVVYSTCSVNASENEEVVKEALSYATDFDLVDCPAQIEGWNTVGLPEYKFSKRCIRSVPEEDHMNGFFIAAFERRLKC